MSVGYNCELRLPQPGQALGPCTDVPYSFSGQWSSIGKMILVVAMFMGRHRGLPHDIDSAIQLPNFSDTSFSSGKNADSKPGSLPFAPSSADARRFRRKANDQISQGSQLQSQLGFQGNQSDSG